MRSLWWWLRGRRAGVGPDDLAIGYAGQQTPFLLAMAGLLAVETAVLGLLVPWPIVHVLDVLALLQVLAIAANLVVHPHVLGSDTLLLRDGGRFALRVPLAAITGIRVESRTSRKRRLDGDELSIPVGGQTTVCLELAHPVDAATRIRFHADEPRQVAAAISRARI